MKTVIIAANGSGSRFGADKLKAEFLQKSVLQHSVDAFFPFVDEIVIVCDNIDEISSKIAFKNAKIVAGGQTRTQSVLNGLKAVSKNCQIVAIHDGARPFVSSQTIKKLFETAQKQGSAIPVLPNTDTTYFCSENSPQNDEIMQFSQNQLNLLNRQNLFSVQTPQVFNFCEIFDAYSKIDQKNQQFSDDSQVYLQFHQKICFVLGQKTNKKITYAADLPNYKIGNGFDVHRLVEGDGVILGGTKIPFAKKLLGHSDADVLSHAIMDALLSASGNKDIGHVFPDTDQKYKGANSINLLKEVHKMVQNCSFQIINISATIIAEQPKIAPYIDEIAQNLAEVLHLPAHSINLTATTTENLGTTANGQAIAASATCLLLSN